MDRERFDALARLVATSASRRGALSALLGVGLSGLLGEAGARKQGKGKRRGRDKRRKRDHKRDRDRQRDRAGEAAAEAACCGTGNCAPGPGKNLAKCCYQGQNLAGKNFKGANLGSTIFAEAILTGANFAGANLDKTCFVDADLSGARLGGANTGTAVFCRTTMPDGSVNDSGCAKGTACCPTCDADDGCDDGQVCCNARCRSGDCCTNVDCEDPREPICANNTCRPCTGDAQCGSGRACCNGICCPAGLRCIDGTCQEGCSGNNDCDPGQVCCDQRCRDGDCCGANDCGARGNACTTFTCRCGAGAACSGATRFCCGQGGGAVCRGCCDNDDCSGNTPFCDASGVCVQCLQNSNCTTSDPCRDAVCTNGACGTTARDDGDACRVGQDSGVCCGGFCDIGAQCCTDEQCTDPARPFCDASGRCVACRNADHCDDVPCQTAVCTVNGQCEYNDQPNGTACNDGGAGVCCGGTCDVGATCCTDAQCTTPAAPMCDASGRCVCPANRVTCNNVCCRQGEVCNTASTPNACCTPTKTTCEVGVDCGDVADGCGGTITCGTCTSNRCAYTDAPEGDACQIDQGTGVCCDGQCQPGNCCTDTQCVNPTPICLGNTCSACTADDQCGPNRTCCNGRCGTGGCCTTNGQCGEGRVCCDGRCREGNCCTNAQCVPQGPSNPTPVCRDNVCSPCTANAECGTDQLCELRDDPPSIRPGTCHRCDVRPDPLGLETSLAEAVRDARRGDTIYICPGEHLVGRAGFGIAIIGDNLTLYGAGSGDDPAVDTILRLDGARFPGIANVGIRAKVMHLSLTGGQAPQGGGVFNERFGEITLQDVAISACVATNSGGGIHNQGDLALEDVVITDCAARSAGGGIAFTEGGSGTLERVAISRCAATGSSEIPQASGGGIAGNGGGDVELVDSIVVGCTAATGGGGISWEESGALTLGASTVSGCTAVVGGGIFTQRLEDSVVILDDSVVSGCTAEGPGGGIYNGILGDVILRNQTAIRGNRSTTEPAGQGIYNEGSITCETRPAPPNTRINPSVCGNPGNAAATLATNCRDTGGSCNNAERPVCLGGAAPGSGACSNTCTSNDDCRSGPCCDGFCLNFGECCGDADCTDPDFPNCINNFCAACTVDGQCGPDRVCCEGICKGCCDNGDCRVGTRRRCCAGICRECCDGNSAQCPIVPRNKPICNAEGICVPCENDDQCVAAGRGNVCCAGECRTGVC